MLNKHGKAARNPLRMWILGGVVLAATGLAVVSITIGSDAPLAAPDWAAIFSPNGSVISLQGGLDAAFSPDKFSRGAAIDNTVFTNPGDRGFLDNGTVEASHDLGNSFFWVTTDASGSLILHAGAERLSSAVDTYVEFEFNQGVVRVSTGAPWPIRGNRKADDLLVRIDFSGGSISSATFQRWDGSAFQTLVSEGPGPRSTSLYRYSAGAPPLQSFQDELWDAAGQPLATEQPDSFVEVGVNLNLLLGSNVEYASIQVRTPQDAIMESFRRIGFWSHASQGGGQ